MDGKLPFYQRAWFYVLAWTLGALIFYVWQISRMGGFQLNLTTIILDGILAFTGLILWLAFFAQFVLPVNEIGDRVRIFSHLLLHLTGGHGPAILVENGREKARKEELSRKGPGVVWLDSASAAQLRTSTKFTRTVGPGVHFTDGGESIAGIVDLHIQSQSIGLEDNDQPFESRPETMPIEEYEAIQKRAAQTRAMTRDGIDVVVKISTTFKLDCDPVSGDGSGSRFGYYEPKKGEENQHPVFKAIANQGVAPEKSTSAKELKTVAWNQFPAFLAADLWREYLSKFTLMELFTPAQRNPPGTPAATRMEIQKAPAQYGLAKSETRLSIFQRGSERLLQQTNKFLTRWVERLEKPHTRLDDSSRSESSASAGGGTREITALDAINEMILQRMTQPLASEMDENGKFTGRQLESPEYKYLKARGLRVLSAGASVLRFSPTVEEGLVNRWNSTWEVNAKARSKVIEDQRKVIEMRGRDQGSQDYLHDLSRSLVKEASAAQKTPPEEAGETLKKLLVHSRSTLIRSDRLERRLGSEMEDLDEIIRWLETSG